MRNFIDIISEASDSNLLTLYHGGNNLESSYDELRPTPKGRGYHGGGIYLSAKASIARGYAKGSRKLYEVTIEFNKGHDIEDVEIALDDMIAFVKSHVVARARKDIIDDLRANARRGEIEKTHIRASVLNNLIINYEAITPKNSVELRRFFIQHGVQYSVSRMTAGQILIVIDPNIIKSIKHNKDATGEVEIPRGE